MITKEKILELIDIVKEFQGEMTINYFTMSDLLENDEFSGHSFKISDKYFIPHGELFGEEITENNKSKIVDKIYKILKNDLYQYLEESFEYIKKNNLIDISEEVDNWTDLDKKDNKFLAKYIKTTYLNDTKK